MLGASLVAGASVVGASVVVETGGAGAETERSRDDLGLRATGKQITSSTRRERVGRGSAQTVTSALGSFFVKERAASSVRVVDVDLSCCPVDDDDDVGSRSGVDVDLVRCSEDIARDGVGMI